MGNEMIEIYNDDCLKILPTIKDKSIDLVLTDPPYGIGADKGVGGFGSSEHTAKHYKDNWDIRPSKEYFDNILRISKSIIIFGGNFFTDLLPCNGHWIVWDKVGKIEFKNPFSDCELAWTNLPKKSIKKYIVIQQGFVAFEKCRFHPTQKPVALFKAILRDYEGETVLDPFMGSGTTGVACKELGRSFIGIEISSDYFAIAKRRIDQATQELFI